MAVQTIPLDLLVVNRANDRHGELENETAAIAWLFTHREGHMKQLAKDIVDSGQIYEMPLVFKDGEKYIVYDGNRRVTCLKLIANPRRAPDADLIKFFEKLSKNSNFRLDTSILCQVENDREKIDEILFRRHTGSQSGVGQSAWNDRMKNTFVQRTGKGEGAVLADEIESRLLASGRISEKTKIPRSNINRLLSSEHFRGRVGFSFKSKKFIFTHREEKVLDALNLISEDLINKKIVLNDIWDIESKTNYLNSLDRRGVLPSVHDIVVDRVVDAIKSPRQARRSSDVDFNPRRVEQKTLIAQTEHAIAWSGHLQRHREIWEELQFDLSFDLHPNAISVLLRVLIEISVDNCISRNSIFVHKNDSLAKKIEKCGNTLVSINKLDEKFLGVLKKFNQEEHVVSADTLNRYVHSPTFAPSSQHLRKIWDSFYPFVIACLNA